MPRAPALHRPVCKPLTFCGESENGERSVMESGTYSVGVSHVLIA
jgi:hypothetical protein